MRPRCGTLYVLLALALLAGNVVLSGHLPGHKVAGSEVCSLCVHAAVGGNAISDNDTAPPVTPQDAAMEWHQAALPMLAARLHDHPSRAPPSST